MTPQGTALVDTTYIDNIITQLNHISVCADLQALITRAMASIQAHISAVEMQIEALVPLKVLLDIPTDLESALTWIGNLITAQIQPGYNAYLNYVEQLAQLVAKIAQLTEAATAAAGRIAGCAIAVPTLALTSAPA